ncbi:MAG: hypothetical protein IJU80_07685, partial [Lachnospiraceae bacterium]|nr:hypothetical protein [Lachnospiraceae bacterium]
MKSKMFKKLMAAVIATTMTASLAACNGNGDASTDASASASSSSDTQKSTAVASSDDATSSSEDLGPYTPLVDKNGNVYDLGGMEIIIRDWWSGDGTPKEPTNAFEEAQAEYRDWIQETYNFKIKQMAISDWGSAPQDFVDYVSSGGDDQNYVFTLRNDPALISAMSTGLCYDLSKLDCLD